MEFLVRQLNRMPADEESRRLREELRPPERQVAQQLRDAGILRRLWRVPGTQHAIGLYGAEDATVLHDALSSLPMFRWLEIEIQPLAVHPRESATSLFST
ncbi:muconolactone Delta-isomerase family protein [Plantactinospora sp. KLBMP9567]|uniref:muconolactone Delta-isomerase n=1 Tax=Plantactinospora sp. KLBMP9567 TaxID=3085900 RepID=UPI0029817081|nr:muconolactone Delta-isomerase family protein [Plantactinospora sp. KLBMP9567]MDW5325324.1 muconolactone Delta-isomerase family protein [Plantactinospora sp. KLBMP9567]